MFDEVNWNSIQPFALIVVHAMAVGLGLLAGLIWPRKSKQGLFHHTFWVNVVTGVLIFISAKPLMNWVGQHVEILAGEYSDYLQFLLPQNWFFQFLILFLLVDFLRYWLHYAHHRVPFLWQFHRVHHSAPALDSTSGLRMHVFDYVQLNLIPIALLGVFFQGGSFLPGVIESALAVGILFDAFQHANLRFDLNRPVFALWHRFFNNPHFHAWHHTRNGHIIDGNYGNSLLLWDRIFRTDVTEEQLPEEFGLASHHDLALDPIGLQLLRRQQ